MHKWCQIGKAYNIYILFNSELLCLNIRESQTPAILTGHRLRAKPQTNIRWRWETAWQFGICHIYLTQCVPLRLYDKRNRLCINNSHIMLMGFNVDGEGSYIYVIVLLKHRYHQKQLWRFLVRRCHGYIYRINPVALCMACWDCCIYALG